MPVPLLPLSGEGFCESAEANSQAVRRTAEGTNPRSGDRYEFAPRQTCKLVGNWELEGFPVAILVGV